MIYYLETGEKLRAGCGEMLATTLYTLLAG
jgi:hypothetical protein